MLKKVVMLPMFTCVNVMFVELLILIHIVKSMIRYVLGSLSCGKIVSIRNQNCKNGRNQNAQWEIVMNVEQVPYLSGLMKLWLLMTSWFHGDFFSKSSLGQVKMESLRSRSKNASKRHHLLHSLATISLQGGKMCIVG